MNALLLPTATARGASALAPARSMSTDPMPNWSNPRDLSGATANTCMFTTNHCTFTGIYGAKRVATGRLPEDLT